MKKKLLILLGILIMSTMTYNSADAAMDSDLVKAIKLYKTQNYAESHTYLNKVIEKDPANALAYYYLGMISTQMGKKEEAIENYDKVLTLSPANNNLYNYAAKGKRCLETPSQCEETLFKDAETDFIRNVNSGRFTDKARSKHEQLEIDDLRREMNRNDVIDANRFNKFHDFSSYNTETPSNDEIVAALRTLQNAGLSGMINNNYSELSLLTGMNQNNTSLNMFSGTSNLNPQLIQAFLTNNMTQGF